MHKYRKALIITLAVVGGLLVVTGGGIGATVLAFRDTFYPGTKVAGIDLSGKTKEEGTRLVVAKSASYLEHPVHVVVPDTSQPSEDAASGYKDLDIQAKAKDLGLTLAVNATINDAWKVGHTYTFTNWFPSLVRGIVSGNRYALSYSVDTTLVQTFIDTQVIPKIGMPVPAKAWVNVSTVVVDPSRPGFVVDKEALKTTLVKTMDTAGDSDAAYIRAPVSVKQADISEADVRPIAETWDRIGNVKITLTASNPDTVIKPKRTDILAWYAPVQDDKGVLSLAVQKDSVSKYLATQKTLNQTKSLTSVLQKVTSLAVASVIPDSLTVGVTLKPTATVSGDGFTAGKFAGKYVEVNLATQRLYAVDGSNLVKAYVVSSGKWSTPTPKGTFSIHSKALRAYSGAFGLYMPYWQNFLNGEYGLHELPEWPNGYKEGQNHLGTPVSHGCVRLGIGDAKELYYWTDIGTPVYIH